MAGKRRGEGFSLVEQLRDAIQQSGRSLNQLAQLTGVDSGRLSRFMTGKRGLSQGALDRIFRALQLRVIAGSAPAAPNEGPIGGEKTPKQPRKGTAE
jgi:transcriptional regulator with XRE-family HTH domain